VCGDRCLDRPRLAVPDVAKQDGVGRVLRRAQPKLGGIAETLDVQLRAVVMRFVKQACTLLAR
jgi:hypothetical protein